MQFNRRLLLPVLASLSGALLAQGPVVSPADRVDLEGSTFSHLPLGRADARVQTLHLDLPGGTVITGHAYRREAAGVYGQVAPFSTDLEVTLSMAANSPSQASPSFAANTGPNPTVVLPRTIVSFPGTSRPAIDPAPGFELMIPYATPFVVPAQGGTLCVDVEVFGNFTPTGIDRNFSVYLDGHAFYTSGHTEQPGYRHGSGCAAPGNTTPTHGSLSLWHQRTDMEIELALRYGVAEDGTGLTRAWVALGVQPLVTAWPLQPQCTLHGSADVWFAMPGTLTAQGHYDGTYGPFPVLPAGYRLWCQSGSAHLGTGDLSFGDGVTIVTPPIAPQPIPCRRISSSSDHTSPTGSLSYSVPVILFF